MNLEVPEGIIHPIASASTLHDLLDIHYWNLQFLNNVIIDQSNVLLPQA